MAAESEPEPEAGDAGGPEERPKLTLVDVKVEQDLVPEWSDLVQKVAQDYGEEVLIGYMPDGLVVRVRLRPERKEAMVGELNRCWATFAEDRKRDGRW